VTARVLSLPVWSERHATACRRHPAVLAVWEGPGGRLAFLLRHAPFPLPSERTAWLIETGDVASAVVEDLRAAGCWGVPIVLGWRPTDEIARVAATWRLRYDADPSRRIEILEAVAAHLAMSVARPAAVAASGV
jgi:hypothetical protein